MYFIDKFLFYLIELALSVLSLKVVLSLFLYLFLQIIVISLDCRKLLLKLFVLLTKFVNLRLALVHGFLTSTNNFGLDVLNPQLHGIQLQRFLY